MPALVKHQSGFFSPIGLCINMEQSERTTRKQLVDKALEAVGWSPIVHYRDGATYLRGAVEEYPTAHGPVDYALFDNGVAIARHRADKIEQAILARAFRGEL